MWDTLGSKLGCQGGGSLENTAVILDLVCGHPKSQCGSLQGGGCREGVGLGDRSEIRGLGIGIRELCISKIRPGSQV